MPFNKNMGLKTAGLAALLSASPLAWSADSEGLTTSWAEGTTFDGGPNKVTLTLGAYIDAYGFYHDHDREFSDDAVKRQFRSLSDTVSGAGFTTAANRTFLNNASNAFFSTEQNFADGLEVEDVYVYLRGEAYDNIVFGVQFDGGLDDTDVELDNWYLGVQNIPAIGQIVFGELDIDQGVGEGQFHDDSLNFNAFNNPEGVGFIASNEYLEGRLGYIAAVGITDNNFNNAVTNNGVNNYGGSDKNYDIQGGFWGKPWVGDKGSLLLRLDTVIHNPSSNNHVAFSDTWNTSANVFKGPQVIGFSAAADEVQIFTGSGSFAYGRLLVGGTYTILDAERPDNDVLIDPMIELIASGGGAPTNYLQHHDFQMDGYSLFAAYSLTGEQQVHGESGPDGQRGIRKPKANFAWDGSGWGAFEVVARASGVDIQDNSRDRLQLINFSTATAEDVRNVILNQLANRQEGGEAREMAAGLNWYLNPALSFGVYYVNTQWEYDNGAVSLTDELVTGANPIVALDPNNMLELMQFVMETQIENDYDVDSLYFRGTVRF